MGGGVVYSRPKVDECFGHESFVPQISEYKLNDDNMRVQCRLLPDQCSV
jgi:hypothetical protein